MNRFCVEDLMIRRGLKWEAFERKRVEQKSSTKKKTWLLLFLFVLITWPHVHTALAHLNIRIRFDALFSTPYHAPPPSITIRSDIMVEISYMLEWPTPCDHPSSLSMRWNIIFSQHFLVYWACCLLGLAFYSHTHFIHTQFLLIPFFLLK